MTDKTKPTEERITDNLPKQQGRRGNAALRINMAFSDENALFLDIVSKDYKVNKTALLNRVIDIFREDHPEVMETAISHQRILKDLHNKREADS